MNKSKKIEEQVVNNLEDRIEMKLAQLKAYLSTDDNRGIANLALYL